MFLDNLCGKSVKVTPAKSSKVCKWPKEKAHTYDTFDALLIITSDGLLGV
jgi:hypothetical protein